MLLEDGADAATTLLWVVLLCMVFVHYFYEAMICFALLCFSGIKVYRPLRLNGVLTKTDNGRLRGIFSLVYFALYK